MNEPVQLRVSEPKKQPEFVCRCKKPCPPGECKDPVKVKEIFMLGKDEFHANLVGLAARAVWGAIRALDQVNAATHDAGEDLLPWGEIAQIERNRIVTAAMLVHQHRELSPQQLHQLWFMRMLQDGWAHGPAYSESLKMHPELMSFKQLPLVIQDRYLVLVGTLKAFWGAVG